MKKNRLLIVGAVLVLLIVNLFASIDESSYLNNINLSKIQAANAEDTEGFGAVGIKSTQECLLYQRKISVTEYLWYVNGVEIWAQYKPSPSATGGTVSRTVSVVTDEIWGIEVICTGYGSCDGGPIDCYDSE